MISLQETKIAVQNLNFYYEDFHALKNINLRIAKNKVTAFIGPSGCGKSTLLRSFNRMFELYPNQKATGEINLDGENLLTTKMDISLIRAKVGMVFQSFNLFENLIIRLHLGNLPRIIDLDLILLKDNLILIGRCILPIKPIRSRKKHLPFGLYIVGHELQMLLLSESRLHSLDCLVFCHHLLLESRSLCLGKWLLPPQHCSGK